MKYFVLVVCSVFLMGCASKYKTDAYNAPTESVSINAKAYVMLANNGRYGSKVYSNSGRDLTNATASAALIYLTEVEQGGSIESLDQAFNHANSIGAKYVFQPKVLHWEDRATEWSGKPDRITVKLVVWNAETRQEISSSVVRASSKWATFGGDHPQDLLPGAIKPFMLKLFSG